MKLINSTFMIMDSPPAPEISATTVLELIRYTDGKNYNSWEKPLKDQPFYLTVPKRRKGKRK